VTRHRRCGGNIGEGDGGGLPETDEMQREGPHFIAAHHAEQCGSVEGGEGSVRWHREGHAGGGGEFCPYTGVGW
jgi:hypothetical protein